MEDRLLLWHDAHELGEVIRAERQRQRLTQDDLAFAAGVSRVLVGQIERGKELAQLGSIIALARTLGLDPAFRTRDGDGTP